MKLYFALAFLALFAMAYGQDSLVEQRLLTDQLRSFGTGTSFFPPLLFVISFFLSYSRACVNFSLSVTGVVLVPIDRAALTITATGLANSAAQAVSDSNNLQSNINATLRNYTVRAFLH